MEQHFVKVTFANDDHLSTTINGTKDEIRAYYIGNEFNLGAECDNMQIAVDVEFLDN